MEDITAKHTLCPSARVESEDSVVFGVIVGTETSPRLAYLKQPIPITDELIAKASRGIPRTINILCDTGLVYGFAANTDEISADIVASVIENKSQYGVLPLTESAT